MQRTADIQVIPASPWAPPASRDADPAGRQIYATERTVVRRVEAHNGAPVLDKLALGPAAVKRVRHERALLERLDAVPGVPRQLPSDAEETLRMGDLGGRALAEALRTAGAPWSGEQALQLAVELVAILGAVHDAGVVHRDLNPANILVGVRPDDPCSIALVDFDLATTFAQVRPGFTDARQIVGRLPYLAPEQTGRTSLGVDQRSDLYAVGAVLFEVLTGHPPFGDSDPLRTVGDILSVVPVPVGQLAPGTPTALSAIVARLLEKEPDARYQSAHGLLHDLRLVASAPDADPVLGARDFPIVLAPPTKLLGRDDQLAVLRAALDRARGSTPRQGVERLLISGAPGVGKSALAEQLRPMLAVAGGWFVSGKADQFGQDAKAGQFVQVMDALGQLLLAQPDSELEQARQRLLGSLGGNAGLAVGLIPSFGQLLGVAAEARGGGDPVTTRRRVVQTVAEVLRGLATPDRPIVMFLDDLQWAGAQAMDTLDVIFADTDLHGIVVVGAYREEAVDEAHPLTGMLERWQRLGHAPQRLRLDNLATIDVGALIGEMLRIPPGDCADLAALLVDRAGGNPYDTMELLSSLRREGALRLAEDGWRWDSDAVRRHVGSGGVLRLLHDRLGRLPGSCRRALQTMSCLGPEAGLEMLAAASGATPEAVLDELVPALEDGLLLAVEDEGPPGGTTTPTLRFRHDRVQQAAHELIGAEAGPGSVLTIARRLLARGWPSQAAALYLEVEADVTDPDEQRRAVQVLMAAAEAARRAADPVAAQRYLACAARLHQANPGQHGEATGLALDRALLEALYELGRLTEADEVYARIEAAVGDPVRLAPSACVQMISLTNRGKLAESLQLGLGLLARLRVTAPDRDELPAQVAAGYDRAEQWVEALDLQADLARAEVTDARVVAAAAVLSTMCPTAYFCDHLLLGWMVVQAQRLWEEFGPQPELVPCLGHTNATGLGMRSCRTLDRQIMQHALAVGQSRDYEPMTARTHFLNTAIVAHWFEPLDAVVAEARAARETLLRYGDANNACYVVYTAICGLFDTAEHLDVVEAEVEAAVALTTRVGHDTGLGPMLVIQHLIKTLRGQTSSTTALTGDQDEDPRLAEAVVANPLAGVQQHHSWAVRDLILDQPDSLAEQTQALAALIPTLTGTYTWALSDLLIGLAAVSGPQADLDTLAACEGRLTEAATTASFTYAHLAALLRAERLRLQGQAEQALVAYDEAIGLADERARPWHQAVIYERAAAYHLELGSRRTGMFLLAEARERYRNWGAVAKVARLDQAYPSLRTVHRIDSHSGSGSSIGLSADALDMMAILAASQAIGSQTDPARLNAVLVDQLRTLTGARAVQVVLPAGEPGRWTLPPAEALGSSEPVETAGAEGSVPLSAFRYVERRREPLVVPDAVLDGRFSTDRYFAGMRRCSLLAMPILSGGDLRAVIVLTSPNSRGAFTGDSLDTVRLLAGQLAVSLDNATLYRSLEAKVEARTRDLEASKRQLEALSVTDALTKAGNRRRFDDAIQAACAVREDSPLSVVMVDIDHFKEYNDAFGHLKGDACIRSVANALRAGLRTQDLVCRYGGEEFAAVLPDLAPELAEQVADRLRRNVEELNLRHPSGGRVTVSAGVTTVTGPFACDPKALVGAADEALYRAKHLGRNRVEIGQVQDHP